MFSDINIPDWGNYFLDMAEAVSKRATCYRAHVGCVLVKDNTVLSTGYNGAPSGRKSCLERGVCYRDSAGIKSGERLEECYSAGAHAEINAIVNAAKHGTSVEGSTLYLIGHDNCCVCCKAAILNVGIYKVVIRNRSGDKFIFFPRQDFLEHSILG